MTQQAFVLATGSLTKFCRQHPDEIRLEQLQPGTREARHSEDGKAPHRQPGKRSPLNCWPPRVHDEVRSGGLGALELPRYASEVGIGEGLRPGPQMDGDFVGGGRRSSS
jgi:hypothetical protein